MKQHDENLEMLKTIAKKFLTTEKREEYLNQGLRKEMMRYVIVTTRSSGILKGKQKLGVTFNSDKLVGIDFTKS